jgi:hypothetical protein
MKEKIIAEGL